MTSTTFRFDRFTLDPGDRQLRRDGAPVELSSRYLDALALLVSEPGRLVSKERFMDEVWRGIPVTDEALTQCIKTLRRQLGDEAASPRFIETVPKHGYRFVAPVERLDGGYAGPAFSARYSWREFLLLGAAGTLGGGVAGICGGLFYGFAGAADPLQPGVGALSVLLVLLAVTVVVGLIGAAGVAFGIAASRFVSPRLWQWSVVGGAIGGALVGAIVKLLGLDAFNLLIGRSPGNITGAPEGALLGGAIGLGAWFASRGRSRRRIVAGALVGAAAGILVPLLGGRLMGGSLDLLAQSFPGSRLRLGQLGSLFGEKGFGPVTQVVTGAFEGLVFAGCVIAAMTLAHRRLGAER